MSRQLRNGLLLAIVPLLLGLYIVRPPVSESSRFAHEGESAAEEEHNLRLSGSYLLAISQGSRRDIFNYLSTNGPADIAQVPSKEADTLAKKLPEGRKVGPKRGEEGISSFKLVGMLLKGDDRLAFVLYQGQPFTLREKDLLENRYEVLSISETSLNLRNRQNNKKFVLGL